MRVLNVARVIGRSPGVKLKVRSLSLALSQAGHTVSQLLLTSDPGPFSAFKAIISIFISLFRSNAHVIILRADIFLVFLLPPLFYQRLTGTYIVIDIPTPLNNWVQEISNENTRTLPWKLLRILPIFICFPLSLVVAHRTIQYAVESSYFSLFTAHRTLLIGNGFDVSTVPLCLTKPKLELSTPFTILCVAALSYWHGYDRLIRGLYDYSFSEAAQPIRILIVGEGPVLNELTTLVSNLGLSQSVTFYPYLEGIELDRLYESAHICASSLGLYRVGLEQASSLKTREYISRGIPFLNSAYDCDLNTELTFFFDIPNDNSNVDLQSVLYWYQTISSNPDLSTQMREYAYKYLSFRSKIQNFLPPTSSSLEF